MKVKKFKQNRKGLKNKISLSNSQHPLLLPPQTVNKYILLFECIYRETIVFLLFFSFTQKLIGFLTAGRPQLQTSWGGMTCIPSQLPLPSAYSPFCPIRTSSLYSKVSPLTTPTPLPQSKSLKKNQVI